MVLINPICIILPSTEKCICFILALKNQTLASSSEPHTLVITLIQLLINQICLNAGLTREMPPVLWALCQSEPAVAILQLRSLF